MEEAQRDLKEGNLYSIVFSRLKVINWIQRKIYLYNVTFGLYMLDWWERCLLNTLVVVLTWFIFYNGFRHVADFCESFIEAWTQTPFEKLQKLSWRYVREGNRTTW